MSDLEWVKKFNKIQITKICKELKVDYPNFITGRGSKAKEKLVKDEIIRRVKELLEMEDVK